MLENSTYTWIIGGLIVLFIYIRWYLSSNDDYWEKRGVPYLPRMSFWTLLYMPFTKSIMEVFEDMMVKHELGRVFGGFEGTKPNLVVNDPDLLRDVLVKDFHVFPYRRLIPTGDPIADSMVTVVTGEDWKRIRTIITPAFTSKRMRQLEVNLCKYYFCGGLFAAFTMDVIARSAFGTQIDAHNDPQNEFVRKVRESFLSFTIPRLIFIMLIPWWILKWFPASLNPMRMDKDNFFKNVTMKVIQKRKETGRRYNDFLQLMMDAAEENAQSENKEVIEDETDRFGSITSSGISSSIKYKSLTDDELLAQCVLFFMVGYETTANILTFVAYCLAVNPEWQEKLIREVDEAFRKHGEMSYDAVREMKILDAVVSETLRMHPTITSGERTAVEDYVLGNTGIVVTKGMRILFPTLAMHYDPEFFQDPKTFNPERFMDSYEPKHPQYAYLPFGAGPRNCLGMRFALLEIKMCISNLLRHFRLKPHSTTKVPLEYKKGMILLSITDLPLTMEKRTDVRQLSVI
ncbi:Cytochrome P450 3A24 like protein [Argiope bruennichi]|uniref:Cytochrome P450 3A24 like protein n=1 Tax=Argiope bruennichi TaxID=94029 RepID=A0A8T0EZ42_ARGBR|nr:Cytochrome P450 3A24 like protein [Argiope bruennichi]